MRDSMTTSSSPQSLLSTQHLPIESSREALSAALGEGPVILSAPTGSGKSTQVPRWCLAQTGGPVLVIEPRRVACRALAARVARLEQLSCVLGNAVVCLDHCVQLVSSEWQVDPAVLELGSDILFIQFEFKEL